MVSAEVWTDGVRTERVRAGGAGADVPWDADAVAARVREQFLSGAAPTRLPVRTPVLASWERCRSAGLSPLAAELPYLPEPEEDPGPLLRAAAPVLQRLHAQLAGTGVSVLLTDARARVVARRAGEPALNRRLDAVQLAEGFSYAEPDAGTNGIGTVLREQRPVVVLGSEHYAERLRSFACAGAPVHDPVNGTLCAVVDLTVRRRDANPLMAALVQEAALSLEQRLLEQYLGGARTPRAARRTAPRASAGIAPVAPVPSAAPDPPAAPAPPAASDPPAAPVTAPGAACAEVSVRMESPLVAMELSHMPMPDAIPSGTGRNAEKRRSSEFELSGDPLGRLAPEAHPGSMHPGDAHSGSHSGSPAAGVPAATPALPAPAPAPSPAPQEASARADPADADASAQVPSAQVAPVPVPPVPVRGLEPDGLSAAAASEAVLAARQRLGMLCEASVAIGTTLDLGRTAEELAEFAVPDFADYATVDLAEWVLVGHENPPKDAPSPLRRSAVRARGRERGRVVVRKPGDPVEYPPTSAQGRCLEQGGPVLLSGLTPAEAAGLDADSGLPSAPALPGAPVRPVSVIAVPIRARGALLGVAAFYRSADEGPFLHDDLTLAEDLVARAGVCLDNARRYTREHAVVLMLQHSLLPRALPEQHAVEAAYRYLPAEHRVGGDWFDVLPLSGGRVALVVGDVVGHGLHAAAAMGRLRTAVRNFAALDLPAEELLAQLDALVRTMDEEEATVGRPVPGHGPGSRTSGRPAGAQAPGTGIGPGAALGTGPGGLPGVGPEAGMLGASCLYVVYDPVTRRCTLASAGHAAPALVSPDGEVTFPDIPSGPTLGRGGGGFDSLDLVLPEDSRLVLYTDGLVGDRGQDEAVGRDRLASALSGKPRTPEELCTAVLHDLLPGRDPSDDVALLVARPLATDIDRVASWPVPMEPEAVARLRASVTRQLLDWGLEDLVFTTELMASELVTNAIRYAAGPVELRLIRDRALICEVADGSSVSPRLRRARSEDEGGRGLFLVAQLAQRWGTRYTADGKVIWAEQRIPAPEPDVAGTVTHRERVSA